MTNPKGTWAETMVKRYLHEHGFGGADRLTKTGNHDRGDVQLCPGVMCEVKAWKSAGKRGPTPLVLAEWMRQTVTETMNGNWDLGFLVVKREGTNDVGRWYVYVEVEDLAELVTGVIPIQSNRAYRVPACLNLADFLPILRIAGWGDQV